MDLIYEVFNADLPRQGPGDNKSTKKAFSYLELPSDPCILDVGCGNGMQTLELARLTNGGILCEIKIEDTVILVLKNSMNRFFQINMDENLVFQRLSDQERIILYAVDYLNK